MNASQSAKAVVENKATAKASIFFKGDPFWYIIENTFNAGSPRFGDPVTMRVEGLQIATDGAIDIPSGTILPTKHEEGNMFLFMRHSGRPTLFVSDGDKWWPAISSADEIDEGNTNKFLSKALGYRNRHTTSASGMLTVTWPAGRFTKPPIVNIQVMVPTINGVFDTTHMYVANIDSCTATGMTMRVRRALVGSTSILLGGSTTIFEQATVPIDVHITASPSTEQ